MRRLLSDRQRFVLWRWQDISVDGQLYLRKLYLVRTPLFQVALHFFHRPDPGRDLHDHPRDFVSIILRGAYVEERPSTTAPLWSIAGEHASMNTISRAHYHVTAVYRRAEDAHRISMVAPGTVSLVLWGRHRRPWGFHTRWGWRHWRTYLGLEL